MKLAQTILSTRIRFPSANQRRHKHGGRAASQGPDLKKNTPKL
jgi:hypothetical protein